jgi:hypothetical protein
LNLSQSLTTPSRPELAERQTLAALELSKSRSFQRSIETEATIHASVTADVMTDLVIHCIRSLSVDILEYVTSQVAISDNLFPPSSLTPPKRARLERLPKFKVGDIAVFAVYVAGRCASDDKNLSSIVMDIKEVTWVAESGSWPCRGKILNSIYATVAESELEKPKYLPGQEVSIEYDGADVKGTIRGVWLDDEEGVSYDIETSLKVSEHKIKGL